MRDAGLAAARPGHLGGARRAAALCVVQADELGRARPCGQARGDPRRRRATAALGGDGGGDPRRHPRARSRPPRRAAPALRDGLARRLDAAGGDLRVPARRRRAAAPERAHDPGGAHRRWLRPPLQDRGDRRRAVRQGGHFPHLLVLARVGPRDRRRAAARARPDGAPAARGVADRALRRGVRRPDGASPRQLPAGLLAPRADRGGRADHRGGATGRGVIAQASGMPSGNGQKHVVIVGGGFAGVGCARRLAKERHVRVTIVDRNNYHQFQPLLYQVATSQLAPSDVAFSLRKLFREDESVDVKLAEVAAVDPSTRTVTARDGGAWSADAIVVAAGSQPNFFRTPGADGGSFPLYTLDQATRLRSRIIGLFEDVDRSPALIERGALNFVVVGAGATGVEIAGALADLVHDTMSAEFGELAVAAAQIHLVDLGHVLLGPFSDSAHEYAAKVLARKGVRTHLGVAVTEIAEGHVTLGDGTTIATHCVIWGGGVRAAELAAGCGLPLGRGGRIDVGSDLGVEELPGIYAVGDVANIPGPHGDAHPQLGSVALQSGTAAAENVLADFAGKPRGAFHYHD